MDQTARGENQAAATRILRANTDDPRFGDSADPEPVRKQSWTAATAIVSDATDPLDGLTGTAQSRVGALAFVESFVNAALDAVGQLLSELAGHFSR